MIVVTYKSIDRCYKRRSFKTLAGAQGFAHLMVGPHPEIGTIFQYAVSSDGIGKVEVRGASLEELFPAPAAVLPLEDRARWDDGPDE
jgi:hypothetical protein